LIKAQVKIEDEHQSLKFADFQAWAAHVEQAHIGPLSWTLGDGPTAGFSDGHDSEVSEAYLSDAQGRQVTPRVRAPPELQNMTAEEAREIMRDAYESGRKRDKEEARAARFKDLSKE